jgi:hypothetical protein
MRKFLHACCFLEAGGLRPITPCKDDKSVTVICSYHNKHYLGQ